MAAQRQKIWITRAQPGAESTAERVRAMGHEAVIAPLLTVQRIADARISLAGVAALAFTSANGVRAFADLTAERGLKVFAVGQSTALAARQAGFRAVLSADGDVSALVQGIASRRRELVGTVLHPGAVELAGDLAGDLQAQGVEAQHVALYDSVATEIADAEILLASDAVLLHSPKAAAALARLLKQHAAPQLRALGLSKAVLRPLARIVLAEKAPAPFPLESALLNLIDRRS